MAILEINLEKPALVEEYQYPGQSAAETAESSETSASDSSGSLTGKLVGLLAVAAGVGLLVWKLKGAGPDQTDFEDFETDDGSESEFGGGEFDADESGGAKRKVASVLGLVVAAASVAAAVKKIRG